MDRSRTTLAPTRERSVHYAWIVAGVVFLTMLGAAGIRSAPGVLMVPLEKDFGWTRATVSLAVSVNLVLFGLMGPFAAALVDRFGARRIVLTSLALLAVGVSLTTRMTEPWQLVLLWGVLVGTGTGMMALATAATVVNHWFTERRGQDGTLRPVNPVFPHLSLVGSLLFFFATAAFRERLATTTDAPFRTPPASEYVRHVQELVARGLAADLRSPAAPPSHGAEA